MPPAIALLPRDHPSPEVDGASWPPVHGQVPSCPKTRTLAMLAHSHRWTLTRARTAETAAIEIEPEAGQPRSPFAAPSS